MTSDVPKMFDGVAEPELHNDSVRIVQPVNEDLFLKSIAREGDVILPLELCIRRREETSRCTLRKFQVMPEICRKISRYARKEFHLMPECPRKLLIPLIARFHFLTEPNCCCSTTTLCVVGGGVAGLNGIRLVQKSGDLRSR